MKIDNKILELFSANKLNDEQMDEVAHQLWESDEVQEEMNDFIAQHKDENLSTIEGVNNYFKKILGSLDIFGGSTNSKGTNSSNVESFFSSMSTILSIDDVLRTSELVKDFCETYSEDHTLDANLLSYYLKAMQGALPEEAEQVVDDLKRGILTFNDNFKNAVQKGDLDFVGALDMLSSDLSIEERYEVFVNFLAALQTLNTANINAESMSEIEDFDTIKQRYCLTGEITDNDIENVQKLIADTFANNSFVMGSVKEMNAFLNAVGEGKKEIKEAIDDFKNDMNDKLIASMMAYVAYKQGKLSSIESENISPEQVAIMTSAAVESVRISSDLDNGNLTIENAIHLLKIVGAVAMYSLLAYTMMVGVGALAVSFLSISGINALSIAASSAFIGYVVYHTIGDFIIEPDIVMNKISDYFNLAMSVWQNRVLPAIVETTNNVIEWIRSQIDSKTIQPLNENNTSTVYQY